MAKESLGQESTITHYKRDRLTIVDLAVKQFVGREDAKQFRDEVRDLVDDSDIGLVVDCGGLTGKVNSYLMGAFVGITKHARKAGKDFAVCDLVGPMKEAYEVSRMSSNLPAYEDVESAVLSIGDPGVATGRSSVQPTRQRRDLEPKRQKRSKRKAKASSPEKEAVQYDGDWLKDNKKTLAIAGSLFGLAALVIICSQFGSSLLSLFPRSTPVEQLTLKGRVQFVARGQTKDDAGAYVVVWPTGASLDSKLTLDDLKDLSDDGGSEAIFATKTEGDGSYELQVEGSDLLNILVVSNNLKDKSADRSNLSAMEPVFADPMEIVGKKGHELGYVAIDAAATKHDVTLIEKYIP